MVALRREIHRFPELAFEEEKTAAIIARELEQLGIPVAYEGVGGGVVGRLTGDPGGPVVALRAEMDALPQIEQTGLPFASQISGKMHACGHDAHIAMVLGAAHMLADKPPPGTVLFVFQPAEESGGGSRVVMSSGQIGDARAIFALHVSQQYKTGRIMIRDGNVTAQSDRFRIEVVGKGGHGARPHEAIDAVVVISFLVNAMQLLVSRLTDPLHPAVVTVGRVRAGTAANIIAGTGEMIGTIRTTQPKTREHIIQGLERMIRAVEDLHEATIQFEVTEGYPPVVNTAPETEIARAAAAAVVGRRHVIRDEFPSMGSEDFSYYLRQMPGCYARLGVRGPDMEPPDFLHSPTFDIDESALGIGAAYFNRVAREAIKNFGFRTGGA